MIPEIGQPIKRELVERAHPDFVDERNLHRLYRETIEGSGGYAPFASEVKVTDTWPTDESTGSILHDRTRRTYLYRHPRERAKFQRRAMMAVHVGVVRKALHMVVGFLTKKDASYSEYPPALERWMEAVDRRRATWRLLRNTELVPMTLCYGRLPVLLHYPPHDAITRAQQIELGADLVAEAINPEVILDWRDSDDGGYHWLKYVEHLDDTESPLSGSHVTKRRFHYLTQEGWWLVDELPDREAKEWPVIAAGQWDAMPLVIWQIKSSGTSLIHHAAQLERELYNVTSLIQEIEREVTFPQRVLPDPGTDKERTLAMGIDNVLWADPQSDWQPYILSPDTAAVEHLMAREMELKGRILEEFGLEFSEGATTGVAQSFKMSKIVRLLVDLAGDLEESEYLTHVKAAEMLGAKLPLQSRATWPTEFDARDVEKEVDALLAVLGQGSAIGNTAQIRLTKKLVSAVDGNIPEDEARTIEQEITQEVQAGNNADEPDDDPRLQGTFGTPDPRDTESR